MTDRLRVPEPSNEAVGKAMREYSIDRASATDGEIQNWRNNLAAAYAIDVPAIVRVEVERALNSVAFYEIDGESFVNRRIQSDAATYLANRFETGEGKEECDHEWSPTMLGRMPIPVTPPSMRDKGEMRTCTKCGITKLFRTAPAEKVKCTQCGQSPAVFYHSPTKRLCTACYSKPEAKFLDRDTGTVHDIHGSSFLTPSDRLTLDRMAQALKFVEEIALMVVCTTAVPDNGTVKVLPVLVHKGWLNLDSPILDKARAFLDTKP